VLVAICNSYTFHLFRIVSFFAHPCCLSRQVRIISQAVSRDVYLLTSCDNLPVCQVWMCGGHLLISTCSHVGHVFRRFSPHKFPGGIVGGLRIIHRNMERLVNVWLDAVHRAVFYQSNGKSRRSCGGTEACCGRWLWVIPCMGGSTRAKWTTQVENNADRIISIWCWC